MERETCKNARIRIALGSGWRDLKQFVWSVANDVFDRLFKVNKTFRDKE